MKKNPKKIAMMGLAATVLFNTTACRANSQPAVYGPDPSRDTTEITTESNIEDAVYGPPEWFEEEGNPVTSESDGNDDKTEAPEQITVEDNEVSDVYGPPVGDE